ncbi:hypothetical protein EDC96DRAFT_503477 [Choanephora cucurbitarum]|nr:hypothetical protein EDC96DRAFT_503477 [Choanephora cucurbitarum]
MCGRFCCTLDPSTIQSKLHEEKVVDQSDTQWSDDSDKYQSSYNCSPWQYIPTLLEHKQTHKKTLKPMRWGFIASWMKQHSYQRPINARSETLIGNQHGLFQESKNLYRCIIIAEGFYEWNKQKQPFYIKRKDGHLMLFAGLYATSTVEGETVTTCAIVTTEPDHCEFSKIHNRVPVILDPKDVDVWINSQQRFTNHIQEVLKPFEGGLDIYRVSTEVNSTKPNSPSLITPLDQKKDSISRFLKPSTVQDESNKCVPEVDRKPKVRNTFSYIKKNNLFVSFLQPISSK